MTTQPITASGRSLTAAAAELGAAHARGVTAAVCGLQDAALGAMRLTGDGVRVLAEAARQKALGWQAGVTRAEGVLRLSVRLPDGSPLPADATVTGTLQRPLDRTALPLAFQPSAPGAWLAPAEVPAPGAWEAVLTIARGADRLELRERLVIP